METVKRWKFLQRERERERERESSHTCTVFRCNGRLARERWNAHVLYLPGRLPPQLHQGQRPACSPPLRQLRGGRRGKESGRRSPLPFILTVEAALFLLDVLFYPGGEKAALEGGREGHVIRGSGHADGEPLDDRGLFHALLHAWEGAGEGEESSALRVSSRMLCSKLLHFQLLQWCHSTVWKSYWEGGGMERDGD